MTSLAKRLSGKRIGLSLASGYFGFYHHSGVLAALEQHDIKPVRITGTSAGALVASMYAAGLGAVEIKDELLSLRRKDFWDVHWPFTKRGTGLLAGERFSARLGNVLPVHGFENCSTPLTVGVYDIETGRVQHLSEGPIIPAVYASCALPYLFTPALIEGRRYWDGGVGEKVPLVPFLDESPGDWSKPEVDAVLVSYLPVRNSRKKIKSKGALNFLPSIASLFVDSPPEERIERDQTSVKLVREAGKDVFILAPKQVSLGPFSLDKAPQAYKHAKKQTLKMLESNDDDLLGCDLLS